MRALVLLSACLATALAAAPAAGMAMTPFDSGSLAQVETHTWTADAPGTYAYHCAFHPSMEGVLHVSDADRMGQTVDVLIQNFTFDPANVTLPKGATVRWTNLDSAAHTVTADSDGMMDDGAMDDGAMMDNGTMMNGTMGDDKMNGTMGDDAMMDSAPPAAPARTPGPGALALLAGLAAVALGLRTRRP